MRDFVSFNNQIISTENVSLKAVSPAAFYGRGVFTTVAIYHSKPFLWQKHWLRLTENAKKINLNLSEFSEQAVRNSLFGLIEQNRISDGRARVTFFDESSISIWQKEQKRRTSVLINTSNFLKSSENWRLTFSPFHVNSSSPLSGVKSCNYLENTLALEDAKAKGFDEAIRLNERGEIVSACLANIFWLKNDEIFTPNLNTGCLSGTTREFVLQKFSVQQNQSKSDELNTADAIFLTSAGIGIVQIAELGEKKFCRVLHEITQLLKRV